MKYLKQGKSNSKKIGFSMSVYKANYRTFIVFQAGSESLILLTRTPFSYNQDNHKITSNYRYGPIYTVLYFLMFSLGYYGV